MNKSMLGVLLGAAVLGTLTLGACGGSPDSTASTEGSGAPAPTAHSLGRIRISVSGLDGTTPTASAENLDAPSPAAGAAQAHVLNPLICFLQIQSTPINSGAFNTGVEQYVSFTFKVRNAQGVTDTSCGTGIANAGLDNVTLVGLVEPGLGISGTPFISLKGFDGSDVPASIAATIRPTHGMVFNPLSDAVEVQAGSESLQVFGENQIAGIPIDPEDAAGSYLVPYGFVVRNVDPALGRNLQSNPGAKEYDGQFTFAVKLPTPGEKRAAVYSFQYDLQALVDTQTRVTESVEEQNAVGDFDANLRALALGSTDVAVLGGSHAAATNSGDPVCTVRIAGTAAAPTAYLANNAANLGVAAAPYNVAGIPTTGPLRVGFCQPVTGSAVFNQFVVNGTETGRRIQGGYYGGSYGGTGTTQIAFTPSNPFHIGEQVLFTLTNGLHVNGGGSINGPWVGLAQIAGSAAGATGGFKSAGEFVAGTEPEGIAVGDFNNDGKLDFATADYGSGTATISLGDGAGGFSIPNGSPMTVIGRPTSIVTGDFNGDGKLDLMVAGNNTGSSAAQYMVLLGNGTGGFSAGPVQALTGAAATSGDLQLVTGDFNGDGLLDVAIANSFGRAVAVMLGSGTGAFTLKAILNLPDTPGYAEHLAVGDFNGDGKLDLAVPEYETGKTIIYLGDGLGNFNTSAAFAITEPGLDVYAVCAGDFNGDGIIDLVGGSTEGLVWLHAGLGNGNFAPAVSFGSASTTALVCRDFNGDGKLDVAVGSAVGNNVTIYLGEGNGQFIQGMTLPAADHVKGLVSGDFTNSGRLDLVGALMTSEAVAIWQGQ
jgi:hypothetical protein